jgi:hypothetical protein
MSALLLGSSLSRRITRRSLKSLVCWREFRCVPLQQAGVPFANADQSLTQARSARPSAKISRRRPPLVRFWNSLHGTRALSPDFPLAEGCRNCHVGVGDLRNTDLGRRSFANDSASKP